jgi:peptidylprolyl isomerase
MYAPRWRCCCPTLLQVPAVVVSVSVGLAVVVMMTLLPLSVHPFRLQYRRTTLLYRRPYSFFNLELSRQRRQRIVQWRLSLQDPPREFESGNSCCTTTVEDDDDDDDETSTRRRSLVTSAVLSGISGIVFCSSFSSGGDMAAAAAAPFPLSGFGKPANQASSSLYVLAPSRNSTTFRTPLLETQPLAAEVLSSELCLLRLLPVKNRFFRELQATIEAISSVRLTNSIDTWEAVAKLVQTSGISELDRKRSQLQPVFNPDEPSIMQILKAERFEILIETLRSRLVDIATAMSQQRNETATFAQQKNALLTLSEIGELLVAKYPYDVPTEGLYSYLPRLLGRCKVTFTFRRNKRLLGNITLIADGYAAPITAGNFVDLCAREFYTGLPIKFTKKRLGSGSEFEVANLPILGSFNDGFYDPLTAKLRRLPLEIIRIEKGSGEPDLTYAQGLSSLSDSLLEPSINSRPLLSFKIPGLVAMNHPDKNPNGASSEFFSLQRDSMRLLDGEYAPFGFIIEGLDLFQELQPNDVIEATKVSEFGLQNLVKLRRSSFSEAVQGSGDSQDAI